MHLTQLLQNISRHIILTDKEITYLQSQFTIRQFAKREYLIQQGQRCRSIYFVNRGVVRSFYRTEAGKETTIMFAFADWWITDMRCFIEQRAADTSLQCLEATEVVEISKQTFDRLFVEIPKFERVFRILMQNAYIREQTRALEQRSFPAEERYKRLIQKYPEIEQLVAQKHLASYLGVTPEFYSQMRKKVLS
ncbi:MAG: Crp/Fnr family transcriptional regulator [Saprospiraceae bacterium]